MKMKYAGLICMHTFFLERSLRILPLITPSVSWYSTNNWCRESHPVKAITSEVLTDTKFYYITSETTVSASYSSEVVGCGGGVRGGSCAPPQEKNYIRVQW